MFSALPSVCKTGLNCLIRIPQITPCQVRNYAARKGTRERKAKKKVKVEIEKVPWITQTLNKKGQLDLARRAKRIDDSMKPLPVDNVYISRFHKWRTYSFLEALECHRESHHPTMYNVPTAPVRALIEVDMRLEKKNRYADNIRRIVLLPYSFEHGEERSVLAFVKNDDLIKEARNAGATLAGGVELIKDVLGGNVVVTDYNYVVAHPNILPELIQLRGIMKKRFPNPKTGNLSSDISELVRKFIEGIYYTAVKDEYEQDYALIDTPIGTLDMNSKHLEENFIALLQDVNTLKPRKNNPFITRVMLGCGSSGERMKIVHEDYINSVTEDDKVAVAV